MSEIVDPMGQFPVAKQFWKVADYIGGSMAEAKTKQMDMRVVDSLQRMGYDIRGVNKGSPAAVNMFGCCPGAIPSSGMLKRRPSDGPGERLARGVLGDE